VRTSDLLRKALVVARKLGLSELQSWINNELNGYPKGETIPAYRRVKGQARAWNPYRGWIPIVFANAEQEEWLSQRNVGMSVAEMEELLSTRKDGDSVPPEHAGNATANNSISPVDLVMGRP
jgi:hypothetical protein